LGSILLIGAVFIVLESKYRVEEGKYIREVCSQSFFHPSQCSLISLGHELVLLNISFCGMTLSIGQLSPSPRVKNNVNFSWNFDNQLPRVLRHWKKIYRVDFFAKSISDGLTNYVIRHNSKYSNMTSLPPLCPRSPRGVACLTNPLCWSLFNHFLDYLDLVNNFYKI
jgi:hypothetical protein